MDSYNPLCIILFFSRTAFVPPRYVLLFSPRTAFVPSCTFFCFLPYATHGTLYYFVVDHRTSFVFPTLATLATSPVATVTTYVLLFSPVRSFVSPSCSRCVSIRRTRCVTLFCHEYRPEQTLFFFFTALLLVSRTVRILSPLR